MKCTDKTGPLVKALRVTDDDEIMLMTSAGQSVRIACAGISKIGRATQGVKLMNLKEGELIQDIARIASDKTEGEEEEDGADDASDSAVENTAES